MKLNKLVPLVALIAVPVLAAEDSCWNDCSIKATEWMNEGERTYEEAAIYHEGCVAGCEGGEGEAE